MTVQLRDSDGTVRLSGDMLATGGATGDVLTQQADGTYAPAGGGSLPAEWTVDGDGGLKQDIGGSSGGNLLEMASLPNANIECGVIDNGDGTGGAGITVAGVGGGGAHVGVVNGSAEGTGTTIDGEGTIDMFTKTGRKAIEAWDDVGNTLRFALLPAGQPMIGVVAVPADGDLSASQCALWFDATDGAAKLKIKAKSADGTVVTGTVNLA